SYFSYPHFYDEPPPLYSTNDMAAAAEQMLTLLENPQLRREAGERGREWVVKRHDYRQVARMLALEYETYAAGSAATAAS
ncbi:MAG: glycosyltransferase, partial [Dehalococcoidia bacterium]